MEFSLELLKTVNRCQIAELAKAGEELLPKTEHHWCDLFSRHVRDVESAIVVSYKLAASSAIRQIDPTKAAECWKFMTELCDSALAVLKRLKNEFPECGTPELYDTVLDYRNAAQDRYDQNLQDAECLKTKPPERLFPPQI